MTPRPLAILYVIDKMVRAGAQRHLRQLLAGFDPRDIRPTLCCLLEKGPLAEELEKMGIPVECLGLENIMGRRLLRAVGRVREIIRRRRIDVVHSYLFAANLVSPPAGLLTRTPVITSRRDTGFWKRGRHLLAHRAVNPLTEKITANSFAVVDYLRRREGAPEKKIVLIYNGVEIPPEEEDRPGVRRGDGRIAIGTLGNIRPVKGLHCLLEALEDLPPEIDCELQIAGRVLDRGYFLQLEEQVRRGGRRDRVRFIGEVADPGGFFRKLDIFVLPSLAEGFSNALLEALARGLPVLATAVGANPEVISPGVNGFLVPPGDSGGLARKLGELCRDPLLRSRLGRAGRRRAEEFSLDRMRRRYRDLYYEVA